MTGYGNMFEVIDSHAHIYPEKIASKASVAIGDFYKIEMDCDGSVEGLLKVGKEGNVSKYLVHSVATSTHQVSAINRFIADELKKHSEFIGFMTLHPGLTEEEIDAEVRLCMENGFYGVKLHPDFQKFAIDSDEGRKIFSVLNERLPILLHTGDKRYNYSNPEQLAKVAKEFKNTNFIGAHFGGYSCWDRAEKAYNGLDNVFFDTSSSLPFLTPERATELINNMGADRFFFGSDYPMWKVKDEEEKFLKLGLTDREKENIFSVNLKNLLKI